jgi:signal transduction histidine kinase
MEIVVQDDGKGFDPSIMEVAANSRKFGLLSVSQRLRHIGGRLDIRQREPKGMTLILRAPLELSEVSGTEKSQ